MIESLHIENIAVIKSLDVEFGQGLTVLTGETGAGKSMIIDSLSLLLGGRADRELLRTGETRGEASALFRGLTEQTVSTLSELGLESSDDSVMLSRVITPGGSSARVNGRAVTLSILREVAMTLFNIHGQNDNQQLLDPKNHVLLLDSYAGCVREREEYGEIYKKILYMRMQIDSLHKDEQERVRIGEMLRYQIADIDSVKPRVGEEEALEELARRLRSVERIQKCCALVEKALRGGEKSRGAVYLTDRAAAAMDSIADAVPEAEQLSSRLNQVRYELEDIADSLSSLDSFDGEDTLQKLDRTEERLSAIAKLKRKYGSTVEEILEFRRSAAERLGGIEHADEKIEDLREDLRRAEAEAKKRSDSLTTRRREAAQSLVKRVTETLAFLDMPKVRFEVGIQRGAEFRPFGCDEVEFLISTNPGEPLMPMAKIASGGELARIMLSLKNVLNECDGVRTVIFDEIDAGISGKTSRKVGIKLKEIGRDAQVLCVTHSAQIASLASHHLFLSKREVDGRAQTTLCELDAAGREEEIARILGGIEITSAQRSAAKELIAEGTLYE